MESNLLHLVIVSKQGVIYDDEVASISLVNKVGPLDILPNHEWFISPVSEKVVVVDSRGAKKEWKITNAIVRVKDNVTELFIEE